ncbi:MAG: trypsin-like peptidase domain-containing protein [Planctomycetes bacterium]|nr:trypsin-like peptidase domain-containing protein [Planctomycetota bacterium]
MKSRFTFVLCGMLMHLFVSQSFAARRDAVVKIVCTHSTGSQLSGSGVCVDKTGVILTASHVVTNGACRVFFNDQNYPAIRVLIPPKEGVAVLKVIAKENLPFLEIAVSQPRVGDSVWVMGFPEGEWSSYRTSVTSDQLFFTDDRSTQLIGVFAPVIFGTSGGPLVTKEWRVAGIASVSGKIPSQMRRFQRLQNSVRVSGTALEQTGGMFLALPHVQEAYQAYRSTISIDRDTQTNKPILYAFTTAKCRACLSFKQDIITGKFAAYDVRVIEHGTSEWRTTISEVQRTVQQPIPNAVPFFWVQGSSQIVQQQQYHAPGLLQILADIIKGLGTFLFNPKAESTASNNRRHESLKQTEPPIINQTDPQPQQEQPVSDVDWSQVTVIVLAAEQDVGVLRGMLRKQALSLSAGPLRRKLAEVTNGKASIEIVAERRAPDRFKAVVHAAGISPQPATLIVLVAQRDIGFAKGLVAKKLEAVLLEKLKEIPVEMIFERAHPADYAAVLNALQVSEREESIPQVTVSPRKEGTPQNSDPMDPRNTIPAMAAAWLAERITTKLRRRLQS